MVADVIAFVFELGAERAQLAGDIGDIAEGVAEDIGVGGYDIVLLPVKPPGVMALDEGMAREVHRAHVQAAHL